MPGTIKPKYYQATGLVPKKIRRPCGRRITVVENQLDLSAHSLTLGTSYAHQAQSQQRESRRRGHSGKVGERCVTDGELVIAVGRESRRRASFTPTLVILVCSRSQGRNAYIQPTRQAAVDLRKCRQTTDGTSLLGQRNVPIESQACVGIPVYCP